jgi:hypothetical protein
LKETTDTGVQRTLESLLFSAKRELAILNSIRSGTDALRFERAALDGIILGALRQVELDDNNAVMVPTQLHMMNSNS